MILKTKEINKQGKTVDVYYVNDIKASSDEYAFAKRCEELNIPYTFQPHTITLIDGFRGNLKNWRDTKYTPDFEIEHNGETIVIEIKGFMRKSDQLKVKLADKYYSSLKQKYFVLRHKGSIKDGTKGFYDYSNPNFKKLSYEKKMSLEFFNREILS